MLSLFLGLAAFVLYLLYDINSFTRKNPVIHSFFTVGTVFLGVATVLDLYASWKAGCFSGAGDILLLAGAALAFAAMIYCLFFALPFEETYADQDSGNRVCRTGVYALCRHPGVLCFAAMYLLLGLGALPGRMILRGMLYSALNLAYVCFQDRVTFPRTFCDYEDYRQKVPFLIPTRNSVITAWKTLFRADSEEDVP